MNAAACSGEIVGGIERTLAAGTTMYSRDGSRKMFAENAEFRAERLLAGETVLARAIAQPRIDDDVVTERDGSDIVADGVDDSTRVSAERPRRNQRDPGQAGDHEQIEMVECGCADPNANVVRRA